MDIDAEILITLVEVRPVLWDKFLEVYKDRNATKNGWHEVCVELLPDFDALGTNEKNAFGKQVISKWTNLRDSFSKYKKRIKVSKASGSGAKTLKKYIYFDQLKFLTKVYEESENVDSMQQNSEQRNEVEENTELEVQDTPVVRKSHKRKITKKPDEVELRILKAIEGDKPCSKMSFLQSVLPHLQKFDDEEFLQFQIEVLKVIGNINGKKVMYSNPPPPHLSQHQFSSYHQPNFAHPSTSQYRPEQYFCASNQSPISREQQTTSSYTTIPISNQSQPSIVNNPAAVLLDISSTCSGGSGKSTPASRYFSQFTPPGNEESYSVSSMDSNAESIDFGTTT